MALVKVDDTGGELVAVSDNAAASRKKAGKLGSFERIARISGRIVAARGLPNRDMGSLSDPYCVIKAIRANNSCVNLHMTKCIMNTLNPVWEEEFDYSVPIEWGLESLVGIRALIYDADGPYRSFIGSDDFLGGVDMDMSSQKHGRMAKHDLEIGGIPVSTTRKSRKPRLEIVITCYLETIPKPPHLSMQLHKSMESFEYIREIVGVVTKATDLQNLDFTGHSDPVCIVRVLLMSGELREVCRTNAVMNTGNPIWHKEFRMKFDVFDQPLLALFDVFDEDDPNEPVETNGEHLGSAIVPLLACMSPAPRYRKLLLQGDTQRHETRLNASGAPLIQVARITGILEASREAAGGHGGHDVDQKIMVKQSRKLEKYNGLGLDIEIADEAPKEPTFTEKLARMGTGLRNWIWGSMAHAEEPLLHLELRTRTKMESMPFTDLVGHPRLIADAEDVADMLADPGWQRTLYGVPADLQDEDGKPAYRGAMEVKDHIAFIYGVVHGAMSLPKPDGPDGNKVDAYCLVHALSPTGEKAFIHRTRVIKNTQNPAWEEAFYFAVPPDFYANRVQLSVYTRPVEIKSVLAAGAAQSTTSVLDFFSSKSKAEQEKMMLDDMKDDRKDDVFLGRAALDLAYKLSGAMSEQEVGLMGAVLPQQEKVSAGFRRVCSISFEVVIERRYRPTFEENLEEDNLSFQRREHHLSRHPDPRRAFPDLAITLPGIPHVEEMATQALELASTSTFLQTKKQRLRHNWVKPPHSDLPVTKTAQDRWELDQEADKKAKRIQQIRAQEDQAKKRLLMRQGEQQLARGSDFTIRAAPQKSSSLPALATNFGKTAQEGLFKRQQLRDAAAARGVTSETPSRLPHWKAQQVSSYESADPEEFLQQKPSPFDLVHARPPHLSEDLYGNLQGRRFRQL